MNNLKPYTIGIVSSLLFHLPFIYFYLQMDASPLLRPSIFLDPALVQCCQIPISPQEKSYVIKPPPLTLPPFN